MPLLLTPGEPAGIGPDITLDLLRQLDCSDLLVVADARVMKQRAQALSLDVGFNVFDSFDASDGNLEPDSINILNIDTDTACTAGKLDTRNAAYVLHCLDIAAGLCRDDRAQALVTAPVHKGIINDAGFDFSGHTEYLAAPTQSQPVMMLATESLRVVLATTHLPLREVADAINRDELIEKISITHDFLRDIAAIDQPHILVCGLNPHAGEDGHLGREEIETITPAIQHCQRQGMRITGPLPADTAFTQHHLPGADAVFAMYHDQGLPVLKYSGFGEAVNITMGLPFIRTSVDHGTALELAGTGKADSRSLAAALDIARQYRH